VVLLLFDDVRDGEKEFLDSAAEQLVAIAILLDGLCMKLDHVSAVLGRRQVFTHLNLLADLGGKLGGRLEVLAHDRHESQRFGEDFEHLPR
jgi:hypothetical protein